jgi:hypothetical protein
MLWPLAECGLPFLLPNPRDHSLAHADSANRKWTAIVSERIYASTFTGAEFVVRLSGNISKDVFIIEGDAINPPAVKWHSPNELIISATQKTTKVPIANSIELQLKEYEGIKISYEIH